MRHGANAKEPVEDFEGGMTVVLETLRRIAHLAGRGLLQEDLVGGFARITRCLDLGEHNANLGHEVLDDGWMGGAVWLMVPEPTYAIRKCRPVDFGGD